MQPPNHPKLQRNLQNVSAANNHDYEETNYQTMKITLIALSFLCSATVTAGFLWLVLRIFGSL